MKVSEAVYEECSAHSPPPAALSTAEVPGLNNCEKLPEKLKAPPDPNPRRPYGEEWFQWYCLEFDVAESVIALTGTLQVSRCRKQLNLGC